MGHEGDYQHSFGRWSYFSSRLFRSINPADPSSDLVTVTHNESRPLQGQFPHLASLGRRVRVFNQIKNLFNRTTAVNLLLREDRITVKRQADPGENLGGGLYR